MAIDNMTELILKFFSSKNAIDRKDNSFKIYNEASLQYELGIYLRHKLKKKAKSAYSVEFERNVKRPPVSIPNASAVDSDGNPFEKKELDLFIRNADNTERYAIEVKYPRNKAYPKRYGQFIEDIEIMEQVAKLRNVQKTYCLTVATDSEFYSGEVVDGDNKSLYSMFRTYNAKTAVNEYRVSRGQEPDEQRTEQFRNLNDWLNVQTTKKGKPKYLRLNFDYPIVWNKAKHNGNDICQMDGYEGTNPQPVFFYLIEIDGTKSNGNTSNE